MIKNTFAFVLLFSSFFSAVIGQNTDLVTWEDCLSAAKTQHPLASETALFDQMAAVERENARQTGKPNLDVQAQAAYQSDVFAFPIALPNVEIPKVPKDQYQLVADVHQTLWDGGVKGYKEERARINLTAQKAENTVSIYAVYERVSDLYFSVLLLQEQLKVLESTKSLLSKSKVQAQAAVQNGVALRTSVDQISIKELELEQQKEALTRQRTSLLLTLQILTGQTFSVTAVFALPQSKDAEVGLQNRPEYAVFASKKEALGLAARAIDLQRAPKAEAFLKGGIGRPNPFNFFETNFQPFAQIGLRATWTPYDWGNSSRQKQLLVLQKAQIDSKQAAFDQGIQVQLERDKMEVEMADAALAQDDAILKLQEDIIQRADAQVLNGVMTRTEYLSQVDIFTKQKINKVVHQIQREKALALRYIHVGGF